MSPDLSLYAVTPDRIETELLFDLVDAAISGGITALQLRRKEIPVSQILTEASRMVDIAHSSNVPVIVNDRVDIALAAGADGVHLGQNDLPARNAARIMPEGAIVGVSTHGPAEASEAEKQGATYLGAGPVYPTGSKVTGPAIGPVGVEAICSAFRGPVVAIGGILPEHVRDLFLAGAAGVAVISGIFESESAGQVERRARLYRESIAEAREALERR